MCVQFWPGEGNISSLIFLDDTKSDWLLLAQGGSSELAAWLCLPRTKRGAAGPLIVLQTGTPRDLEEERSTARKKVIATGGRKGGFYGKEMLRLCSEHLRM